ncbi:NADPH-dependent FMN reductase [Sphingomonas sp.]|uniref:NADPH-dependent FMN reductase n=1 Tax=Sphingomonas sp. TaxID=28214 RepID=UPI002DD6272D|nr:NAD(P)H-dependent oxidoreductase [Sphingomonas sp.]
MFPIRLHVIVGSIREGRLSGPIADWVIGVLGGRDDFAAELVDLKDVALPMLSVSKPPAAGYVADYQRDWAARVGQADAYLIVTPEYNHGVSPVLKNALDHVYGEWARKPVAFVAHGGMGGARAVEQLQQVAVALAMAPMPNALHLQGAGKKREGDRFLGDEADARRLNGVLDDLAWWATALRAARA